MGADLYIEPLQKARHAKYSKKYEAAVAKRDALWKDLQAWGVILDARKSLVAAGVGAKQEVKEAENKLAEVKGLQQVAQHELERLSNLMYEGPGYFRDSYNGSSVLWRLDLSWWSDCKGGKMSLESLKTFLQKVKESKLKPLKLKDLKDTHCKVDDKENSIKVWQNYYRNKKRRLVKFLERAVVEAEQGGEVYFSL
jgi:hypothetical protein